MKVTNHKDGSRSFRFSSEEQVCGSQAHQDAWYQMASCTGGIYPAVGALLAGEELDLEFPFKVQPTSFGTETLTLIWKMLLRQPSPYNDGCREAAEKELAEEKTNDHN